LATCAVEQGYTCTGIPLSTCTFTCGDGTVTGNEQCDDGNTNSGDVCSSVCQYEFTPETEANGTCAEANGPFNVPFVFDASITPAGDQDFVAFTVPNYADVKVETFSPTIGVCPTGTDTVIQLRGSDCTTIIASDDDDGINSCSVINPSVASDAGARNLAPGTYYVRVEEYLNNGVISSYKLQVSFAPVR
jgi:cysteine-rich repeat protein